MPTWGDARVVGLHVTCERLKKGGLARPVHSAKAQVGVDKHSAHEVGTVVGAARTGGSWVWGRSENGGWGPQTQTRDLGKDQSG